MPHVIQAEGTFISFQVREKQNDGKIPDDNNKCSQFIGCVEEVA